jgi:hypothetical protein
MKPCLIPVYFQSGRDAEFNRQLAILRSLLAADAEIVDPVPLGSQFPHADAVIFPQLLGDAYKQIAEIKKIDLPLLVITSEFGSCSMWDWEIASYLRSLGTYPLLPHNLDQARKLLRAISVRKDLKRAKFLVFQDNPGAGQQASIFKRFYWWENECAERIRQKFGISIVKKSFKTLGEKARQISDGEAESALSQRQIPYEGVKREALRSAIKLYLAVKDEIQTEQDVVAAGMNCLNESHFSDTTPCLAWNLLYEEEGLIWGCEADTVSMLTKYILNKSLGVSIIMTNLYPFLIGMAALKHEKITGFPNVERPEDCLLVAHCGYLGVVPQSFSIEWKLRPKVLSIVEENSVAIDARLPEGKITLAKMGPTMESMTVVEGQLERYVQYPGSDCRNGGLVRVRDGRKLVESLYSHHYSLMTGHNAADIQNVAHIFRFDVSTVPS